MAGQVLRCYIHSITHHIPKGLIYDQFTVLSSITPFNLNIRRLVPLMLTFLQLSEQHPRRMDMTATISPLPITHPSALSIITISAFRIRIRRLRQF
jgi:hypothetical protein